MTFAWRPGSQQDVYARCRQCTGKRLSRAIWSSLNKERMSHLYDSTVAGPTARRDNVLASKCEYPPFRYPPFKCALSQGRVPFVPGTVPVCPEHRAAQNVYVLSKGTSFLVSSSNVNAWLAAFKASASHQVECEAVLSHSLVASGRPRSAVVVPLHLIPLCEV